METNTIPSTQSLLELMLEECQSMARYALSSGMEVPGSVLTVMARGECACEEAADDDNSQTCDKLAEILAGLTTAHQQLAKIVAPATPRAITLLAREESEGGVFRMFGSVPLIRKLIVATLGFLALLILMGMSKYTSHTADTSDIWSIYSSSGIEMLTRVTYLIAAAGLGACFAALFRANKFIVDSTYDPKYATSYWIRVLMGVISGVLLCEMIPLGDDPTLQGIGKPTLALLGGFSGNTVYRILERLVHSVESIVSGDTGSVARAQLQAAESEAGQSAAEKQAALTAKLAVLRQQLDSDDGAENAKKQLDALMAEMGKTNQVTA